MMIKSLLKHIRHWLVRLGVLKVRRVTFNELFIKQCITLTEQQWIELVRGCLTLGKLMHLESLNNVVISDKLSQRGAYNVGINLIKDVIMEFARINSTTFETAFQIIINRVQLELYIKEKLIYYNTRLQSLIDTKTFVTYYRDNRQLLKDDEINRFDDLSQSFLYVFDEIKLASDDVVAFLKDRKHQFKCWYPLDYLKQMCQIAESKGDERWVDEETVYNKTALSSFVKSIQCINRYILTSAE